MLSNNDEDQHLCSTYTLQQAVTHSHYIISFTRVLGCQHLTNEKAEMNSGIHHKMICLVTLLISWVESRLVPKSRFKGLATTMMAGQLLSEYSPYDYILESQEYCLPSFFLKTIKEPWQIPGGIYLHSKDI